MRGMGGNPVCFVTPYAIPSHSAGCLILRDLDYMERGLHKVTHLLLSLLARGGSPTSQGLDRAALGALPRPAPQPVTAAWPDPLAILRCLHLHFAPAGLA